MEELKTMALPITEFPIPKTFAVVHATLSDSLGYICDWEIKQESIGRAVFELSKKGSILGPFGQIVIRKLDEQFTLIEPFCFVPDMFIPDNKEIFEQRQASLRRIIEHIFSMMERDNQILPQSPTDNIRKIGQGILRGAPPREDYDKAYEYYKMCLNQDMDDQQAMSHAYFNWKDNYPDKYNNAKNFFSSPKKAFQKAIWRRKGRKDVMT